MNILFFLNVVIVLILVTFIYAAFRAAPWVPMRAGDVQRFLDLAEIKPGQKVYDLGCGDARLVCASAKAGASAVGFEISVLPLVLAYIRILLTGAKCKIIFRDFWNANLGDADVVYFFLTPPILEKMRMKFEKELKKGAKVVCYVWQIPGWQAVKVSEAKSRPKMYLYEIN